MHIRTSLEVQSVIGSSVGREPEASFDILPKGFKYGIGTVLLLLHQTCALSVGLDNLQVSVFHPNAALKVALVFFQLFWRYVKNIGAQLVDPFPAYILDVDFWSSSCLPTGGPNLFVLVNTLRFHVKARN